jgi:hypothetical protein
MLAQVNIAKMLAPIDSPVMSEFVANLDRINRLAESSAGFIWRLKDDTDNATHIKVYDDDFIIVNMSVWRSPEDLSAYVYRSDHAEVFKRRKEWFSKMDQQHMALWYISDEHRPTVEDAVERLNYLRTNGDTPFAFGFRKQFTQAEANEYVMNRIVTPGE